MENHSKQQQQASTTLNCLPDQDSLCGPHHAMAVDKQCQWFRELASIPFQNFLIVMLDAIRKFECFLEFPLWAFLNSVHHKDRHAWMISRNQQCNCFRSDLLPTSESIIKYLSTTHSTICHFLWATTDERTWTIFCAVAVRLIFESYGSSKLPVDLYSFRSCSWH